MRGNKWTPYILLLLLLAAFGYGVGQLFNQRFRLGDMYPPYSSFRADPLGTKMFYESLDTMEDIAAERNLTPFYGLDNEDPNTLFLLGMDATSWISNIETGAQVKTIQRLSDYARNGGRLVIGFKPETDLSGPMRIRMRKNKLPVFDKDPDTTTNTNAVVVAEVETDDFVEPGDAAEPVEPAFEEVMEHGLSDAFITYWDISLGYRPFPTNELFVPARVNPVAQKEYGLWPTMDWHTGVVFTNLGAAWETIYERGSDPVAVERRLGAGSIVILTDSYHLSNESLWRKRPVPFLRWLVGEQDVAIFDETHLGVTQKGGVMILARQYRLHGFFFGLLVLAGLLIWQSMSTLIPRYDRDEVLDEKRIAMGKDSAEGLLNLLRRHLPIQNLVPTCVQHWKRTLPPGKSWEEKARRVEQLVQFEKEQSNSDPAETYRRIHAIIKERKY